VTAVRETARPPVRLHDVLLLVGTGDVVAFGELFDRTAPQVFGVVCRFVLDGRRRERLMSDIYVDVWRRSTTYAGDPLLAFEFVLGLAVECIRTAYMPV
jgi:hypothetical protein